MEKLFKNILSAFLTPINLLFGGVIFLYFLAYVSGNVDDISFKLFSFVFVVGNIISGLFLTIFDNDNIKSFEEYYIYGNSEKGREN